MGGGQEEVEARKGGAGAAAGGVENHSAHVCVCRVQGIYLEEVLHMWGTSTGGRTRTL